MDIDQIAIADRNTVMMGARGIVAECMTREDAIRIAACINACRGMSNYVLSVGVKSTSQITRAVVTALSKIDDARAVLDGIGDLVSDCAGRGAPPAAGERWVRIDDNAIEVVVDRVAGGTVFYSFHDLGMRAMPDEQFAFLYRRMFP